MNNNTVVQVPADGIDGLRELACPFVVVLRHPRYYPRFDFVPAARYGITATFSDVPQDAFMIWILPGNLDEFVPGAVRFREEFSSL